MLNRSIRNAWDDEQGVILSMEMILIATLVVIGLIVGYATLRDAMVQELGDTAAGVARLQQSYSFGSAELAGSFGGIPYEASSAGSEFVDESDRGEDVADQSGQPPLCMEISDDGAEELF